MKGGWGRDMKKKKKKRAVCGIGERPDFDRFVTDTSLKKKENKRKKTGTYHRCA